MCLLFFFHSTAFDLNFLHNFIQKDDFWWSWQRYQFLCYINPCFCFLHQKSATNFVASQRYQDWGAGAWTSKSQLRNCGEGHGFLQKNVTVVLLFRWLKLKTLSPRRFAELEDLFVFTLFFLEDVLQVLMELFFLYSVMAIWVGKCLKQPTITHKVRWFLVWSTPGPSLCITNFIPQSWRFVVLWRNMK